MEKAADLGGDCIFAVGNAPTAWSGCTKADSRRTAEAETGDRRAGRLCQRGSVKGNDSFAADTPFIVARGRKGGSNVAAAICNALLYQCT